VTIGRELPVTFCDANLGLFSKVMRLLRWIASC
jgi:hypothetical protein